ncbi:MAG: uracil-DNA glycosylase [Desulfobacterales bacterium]|nr:MAG: uracil-DNA glycosylase [Desulfobacterales bacterium]
MLNKRAILETVAEINYTLHQMAVQGCRGFESSQHSLKTLSRWGQDAVSLSEKLEEIRLDLGDCQRCKLASGRKHIVFGNGNANAKLVFVGEGPGFEEDQKGEPFVGPAGKLLTRIIQAIKLSREQVYICNIIKCRPPGNRDPERDEIEACLPFLERQISAIKPDFICTLGKVAAQTLLKTDASISKLRGRFHEYKSIKVLPTYHPAFLLRNPEKKRDVWEDMKKVMREYRYED